MAEDTKLVADANDPSAPPTEVPLTPEELAQRAYDQAHPLIIYSTLDGIAARTTTADAQPVEVLRFACDEKHLYYADLKISGVDAGSFASKILEGRFTWKRNTTNAIIVGQTVVSDIHDVTAAALAATMAVAGTDIVITVTGVAGRTIDWTLTGQLGAFVPGGTPL